MQLSLSLSTEPNSNYEQTSLNDHLIGLRLANQVSLGVYIKICLVDRMENLLGAETDDQRPSRAIDPTSDGN